MTVIEQVANAPSTGAEWQ